MPRRDGDWLHIDRSFFSTERLHPRRLRPEILRAPGAGGWRGDPVRHARRHCRRCAEGGGAERSSTWPAAGSNLCLAGGLGLNALLVSALERSAQFENVFVQPAAGNAGTAMGAVLEAWHSVYGQTARVSLGNLCLGPSFHAEEIKQVLENCKLRFKLPARRSTR